MIKFEYISTFTKFNVLLGIINFFLPLNFPPIITFLVKAITMLRMKYFKIGYSYFSIWFRIKFLTTFSQKKINIDAPQKLKQFTRRISNFLKTHAPHYLVTIVSNIPFLTTPHPEPSYRPPSRQPNNFPAVRPPVTNFRRTANSQTQY